MFSHMAVHLTQHSLHSSSEAVHWSRDDGGSDSKMAALCLRSYNSGSRCRFAGKPGHSFSSSSGDIRKRRFLDGCFELMVTRLLLGHSCTRNRYRFATHRSGPIPTYPSQVTALADLSAWRIFQYTEKSGMLRARA